VDEPSGSDDLVWAEEPVSSGEPAGSDGLVGVVEVL
jgi:hypothetical protein